MKRKGQCSYSSEFKREATSLVISQGYGIVAAARAVGVSKSTISTWVRCLRQEQKGGYPQPAAPDRGWRAYPRDGTAAQAGAAGE